MLKNSMKRMVFTRQVKKEKLMLGKSENSIQVIRVMPNLAIANGNGILGITYDDCDNEAVQETVRVFENLGYSLRLDEEQLDYITVRVFENVIDMIKKDGGSFSDIVNRITTKGGITEAGMKCLEPEQIKQYLENCLEKSIEKARNIYD